MNNNINWEKMLENTNLKIEDLQKKIKEYEKVIYISDKMLKAQGVIIILMTLMGFIFGGFSNLNNFLSSALYNSLMALLGTIPAVLVAVVYFSIGKICYKDKISELEHEIAVLNTAKMSYEKKLTNQKENNFERKINKITTITRSETNINSISENNIKKLTLKKRK